MDLTDSPSEAAFRARLRAWLAEHVPAGPEPATLAERFRAMVEWQKQLYDGGWVALSWPVEYGGQGLGPIEEAIFSQELVRAAGPPAMPLGYLGRPILMFGTEEQKRRYLPPLLRCDELWCQGFSEPDAGSDLAGIQTRAVPDGDRYLVSGQKVWTSYGPFADLCLLLARTDATGPRHRGITAFVVPMDAPGVTVRPIVQITGDEEFCEIFLDETPVPAENVVGELGQGWDIAQGTLVYERGAVDIGFQAKFESMLNELLVDASARGRMGDTAVRHALAEAAIAVEVLRLHGMRSLTRRAQGAEPGPASSIDKLLMSQADQRLLHSAVAVAGAEAVVGGGPWFERYLYSRAGSIYGGTSQIQRNILATRVLGLPRG